MTVTYDPPVASSGAKSLTLLGEEVADGGETQLPSISVPSTCDEVFIRLNLEHALSEDFLLRLNGDTSASSDYEITQIDGTTESGISGFKLGKFSRVNGFITLFELYNYIPTHAFVSTYGDSNDAIPATRGKYTGGAVTSVEIHTEYSSGFEAGSYVQVFGVEYET